MFLHPAKKALYRDCLIALSIALGTFIVFILLDLTELWYNFTRDHEEFELDETFGLILGLCIGLLFLTYRLMVHHKIEAIKNYELSKELEVEANFDQLTSLPNRRAFKQRMDELISNTDHGEDRFTLLSIDLDNFKYINDMLGHSVGDQLLVEVSQRLNDIGYRKIEVFRVGGDEFCVILLGNASNEACLAVCTLLDEEIGRPFAIEGQKLHITQSIGISRFPEDGSDYEQLLSIADSAMFMGKIPGKDNNNFKDGAFIADMERRFIIQHGLRDAIERRQFFVEYQPKVDINTGQLIASEALVRWHHPEHGRIAPDEFIYIAEETHSVQKIDLLVLEMVCDQLQQWGDIAKPVAVNLSPLCLADESFPDKVSTLLDKYQVSHHLLEFEITERTVVVDSKIPLKICQEFERQGIVISLDDFGTGYSSLSHLADFPINKLKIDRSFILRVCENERTYNIVAAIVALAKALQICVIAEGVETTEQHNCLRGLGCEEAQGYLFDAALPANDFHQRLLEAERVSSAPS
ncbi:MAG: putative bifunctional diguanylate cyclase/phosphodiesterase [Cellvibrionaceae bacterium]